MGRTFQAAILFVAVLFLFTFSFSCYVTYSLPLSTQGRWIIDSNTGHRVKLVCVNWPSHTQTMLIEGLNHRPLKELADEAIKLRFNCVRLTYATHMFTRYANRTVEENFELLDLREAKAGLVQYNPFVLNMTIVEAYEAVVDVLGASGLMVIADNHISQPRWCCSNDDGNGFFGDRYFDPQEWLQGLSLVAQRFTNKSTVVGMSLRNELRGAKQNANDWNKYVTQGATTIHKINPQVLVIISGLSYDNDLRCVKEKPLNVGTLDNKLVFEVHWYSFGKFAGRSSNNVCADIMNEFVGNAEFVIEGSNPFPLIVTEFGYDQREVDASSNRFMSCFSALIIQKDLDWGLWGWQGSYYYREGQAESADVYGVLDSNWTRTKNPNFLQKFHLLQTMLQDPNSNASFSNVIYHPQSGQCMKVSNDNKEILMSNCTSSSGWSHDNDGTPIKMSIRSGNLCLKANGEGLEPSLSTHCLGGDQKGSAWTAISNSKLHLATSTQDGKSLCLQIQTSNSSKIVTTSCICTDGDPKCLDDTQSQWFQLVQTNTL